MGKKRIKKLERKVSYLFDLLINLAIKVGEINTNLDSKEVKVLNNEPHYNYTIVKDSKGN